MKKIILTVTALLSLLVLTQCDNPGNPGKIEEPAGDRLIGRWALDGPDDRIKLAGAAYYSPTDKVLTIGSGSDHGYAEVDCGFNFSDYTVSIEFRTGKPASAGHQAIFCANKLQDPDEEVDDSDTTIGDEVLISIPGSYQGSDPDETWGEIRYLFRYPRKYVTGGDNSTNIYTPDEQPDDIRYDQDPDEWHHVVAVKNGEIIALYVDGAKISEKTVLNQPNDDVLTVFLGILRPGLTVEKNYFFEGQLRNLQIYNYALPEEDILSL